MLITIDEARRYSHDYETQDEDMEGFILAAEDYIEKGVGKVSTNDPKAKLLCKLLVCDMTDNKTLSAAQSNSRRGLVNSIILQLKAQSIVSNSDTEEVTGK